jgi:integrase/recombinase XerC
METETITIQQAIQHFLGMVAGARSKNTVETYGFALRAFSALLADNKIDVEQASVSILSEDLVSAFADWLKKEHATATEQLYLQAVSSFYEYLAAEQHLAPNMLRLRQLLKMRTRKTGQRLPQFPREDIEKVLEYVFSPTPPIILSTDDVPHPDPSTLTGTRPNLGNENPNEHLRWLRDRAFLLTLADTGLRVHEACKLTRGQIDWNEGRAIVIGKGDKQAVVRFSSRALSALKEYLSTRGKLDGAAGKQLSTLPVFARHDKGAGKKVKAMTTATGRNIVDDRGREALGEGSAGRITPHSFRHYFVATVLRASGNLKLAQELARHANISVTQRYAHLSDDELDKGYFEIFERRSDS